MASRSEQVNRNIRLINQFLMNQNLMKQRQTGYMGLETERHKNMMTRLGEDFSNKIARDPVMERHRSLIFKAQERGEDTSALVEAMKKDALEISKVAFTTATGQPWTKDTASAATLLTEDALVRMGVRGARTTEQVRDIIEVQRPGQELRGKEVAVREKAQKTREEELAFEREKAAGKTGEQYQKGMIDVVKDTVNFLEAEGVTASDLSKQDRILFGSGKVTDPLSPENRGKAFTYLMEIWTNLVKGKTLTSNEENFLINVRNTSAIQPTAGITPGAEPGAVGGLPSPRTGLTPGQEGTAQDMINNRLIEMATKYYMELGKLDEATARQMAQKLIGGLR